ncbi:LutC/YkgG family protein [Campylobacter gastrosuis]|uniref:Lactate utilization protein C n=1 Tax=Campylobacter gastrosuis TaxID=2974576 RepID=A0ABT7HLJ6_9BACT|nr:lactate utilization protein C [Campylobacter gastrosuis]MDL0087854.1 lactate utilization protein C [Campylobacter gastrosuis]MDL0088065.1 lactate utilization protein C [Campylobacter gastrosuis]
MSSKEYILNAIRTRGQKIKSADGTPTIDPVGHIKDDENLYKEFITRSAEHKSNVIESSLENLANDINAIFEKEGVKNLIYPEGLPVDIEALKIAGKFKFDTPIDGFKENVFDYDVSVINARHAVSSHGICCIASSKEQPRLLSLTPKVCIMLVNKEKITKSISSALNNIKQEEGGKLPTNVVFIAGPSRTADIELVPVLGVHGSQIAYVVVY